LGLPRRGLRALGTLGTLLSLVTRYASAFRVFYLDKKRSQITEIRKTFKETFMNKEQYILANIFFSIYYKPAIAEL